MAQTFRRSANTVFLVTLIGLVLMVSGLIGLAYALQSAPWVTRAYQPRTQPIQFSHERHAGGNGIDCRYCHTSVEVSSFAGIPPTKTCMNCHSQIFKDSPFLELVRASFRDDRSIQWTRVYDLPDFVYFNHSIHVNKGIGCSTCHGRVDLMPLTYSVQRLEMRWCLDCHRNPGLYVRPRSAVFDMTYRPPADQRALGRKLVAEYGIQSLTSCSTCHR
jgi:Cytochrome c7 and related cytochrome c/Class III cytochrome C family